MASAEKGDRVMVAYQIDKGVAQIYGFGVYNGLVGHEDNWKRSGSWALPKITLDSGKVVWGNECFYGTTERICNLIGNNAIEVIAVDGIVSALPEGFDVKAYQTKPSDEAPVSRSENQNKPSKRKVAAVEIPEDDMEFAASMAQAVINKKS